MGKRKRVGILFTYADSWIAGAYYLMNIIKALNTLQDSDKPEIYIVSAKKENFDIVKNETSYPYLKFAKCPSDPSLFVKVINKIGRVFTSNNLVSPLRPLRLRLDFLYHGENKFLKTNAPKIEWIPDFQEQFLPEFFSKEEIKERTGRHHAIAKNYDGVVFSSENAKNHFTQIIPKATINLEVLKFAVTHGDYAQLDFENLRQKHGLPNKYYFIANQFWAHKNHKLLFEALAEINKSGENDIRLVCSGKKLDSRNKAYFDDLMSIINKHNLVENVVFLGFIDRLEQLKIMSEAHAIIQPSLFEGWSTVVEDAKAMSQRVLISDIPLHREQIGQNCTFFDPYDSIALSKLLHKDWNATIQNEAINYSEHIKSFGLKFMEIVNKYSA